MAGWVGEWEERLKFGRIGRQGLSTSGTVPGPASLIALLVRICTYIRLRRASDDGFCQSAIMSGVSHVQRVRLLLCQDALYIMGCSASLLCPLCTLYYPHGHLGKCVASRLVSS